ncbi:MAG: hypothetical protein GY953_02830, partial [bacterium]|nr:hypothetical protein [bacterium]
EEKYDRQSTADLDAIKPDNGLPGALTFAGRDGVARTFQPILVRPEPFLSVAWSPFGSPQTVFRGSVRQFYRGIPMHSGQWGTQGFNGTPTYITQNAQLQPAVALGDGLPAPPNPPPDLRPEAANDTIADLVEPSGRQPSYRYIRVSAERQFPASVVLTVGVNHSRAKNMLAGTNGANPNAIPLDALAFRDELNDEDFNRSLRPFPQYQRFDVRSSWPIGRYARDEGYFRVEKRISQGLSFRASYDYSKQMDDYVGRNGLQDYYDRSKDWSL